MYKRTNCFRLHCPSVRENLNLFFFLEGNAVEGVGSFFARIGNSNKTIFCFVSNRKEKQKKLQIIVYNTRIVRKPSAKTKKEFANILN